MKYILRPLKTWYPVKNKKELINIFARSVKTMVIPQELGRDL